MSFSKLKCNEVKIVLTQRARTVFGATLTDADGNPFDLTNYWTPGVSPKGQVRKSTGDPATNPVLVEYEFEAVDLVNGQFNVVIPPAAADIERGGVWDVFIINSTDATDVRRVLKGILEVDPSITVIP